MGVAIKILFIVCANKRISQVKAPIMTSSTDQHTVIRTNLYTQGYTHVQMDTLFGKAKL